MTSPESYTSYNEELKQLWGNKSFAYPIAAKVYEGTNGKLQNKSCNRNQDFSPLYCSTFEMQRSNKTANYQIAVSVHVIDLLNTAPIRSHADDG